jgi:hypothetical protein
MNRKRGNGGKLEEEKKVDGKGTREAPRVLNTNRTGAKLPG